jgi:hypothetical protein
MGVTVMPNPLVAAMLYVVTAQRDLAARQRDRARDTACAIEERAAALEDEVRRLSVELIDTRAERDYATAQDERHHQELIDTQDQLRQALVAVDLAAAGYLARADREAGR